MRSAAVTLVLIGLAAASAGAQGRGRNATQGVPPGHLPPPGQCRVWYDGRPPGRQPPPINCSEAERIAARDPYARVVYGGPGRQDNRRVNPRMAPGYPSPDRNQYPNRYPNGGYGYERVSFDNGYRDGYEKGLEDLRDNDRYDPSRHAWYRSASRGYDSRYGTRDEYSNRYRDGFRAGYEDAYRGAAGRRSGAVRSPWPY